MSLSVSIYINTCIYRYESELNLPATLVLISCDLKKNKHKNVKTNLEPCVGNSMHYIYDTT